MGSIPLKLHRRYTMGEEWNGYWRTTTKSYKGTNSERGRYGVQERLSPTRIVLKGRPRMAVVPQAYRAFSPNWSRKMESSRRKVSGGKGGFKSFYTFFENLEQLKTEIKSDNTRIFKKVIRNSSGENCVRKEMYSGTLVLIVNRFWDVQQIPKSTSTKQIFPIKE